MLDIMFILLFFMAFMLMLFAISNRNNVLSIVDFMLWLILALIPLQGIEVPYQMYNATAGKIETGMQTITLNLMYISLVFMALAIVMFIFFMIYTFEYSFKTRYE